LDEHNLTDMADIAAGWLENTNPTTPERRREVIKSALAEYWKERIALVWNVHDIMDAAKEINKAITREEGVQILQRVIRKQDCTIGVSFDTIKMHIEMFLQDRNENDGA
jgi:hypothetical protein